MSEPKASNVEVLFTQGLRQDLEEDLVQPGMLTEAVDVEFDKAGRLQKRGGFSNVGTQRVSKTYTFRGPARGFAEGANGEQLIFTDLQTFVRFPTAAGAPNGGTSAAGPRAQIHALRASVTGKTAIGGDQGGRISHCDTVAYSNWVVTVYRQRDPQTPANYDLFVDITDTNTGAKALTSYLAMAGIAGQPRAVLVGSTVFLICANPASANISYCTIDLSGNASTPVPDPSFVTNLITDAYATNPIFDAATTTDGFVIAYAANVAGTHEVHVKTFSASATLINSYVWLDNSGGPDVAWDMDGIAVLGCRSTSDALFVVASNQVGPSLGILTTAYDLTSVVRAWKTIASIPGGQHAYQNTLGRTGTGACIVLSSAVLGNPLGNVIIGSLVTAGTYASITPGFANYTLASKFFADANANLYAWFRFTTTTGVQSHYLLVDFCGNANQSVRRPCPVAHVASGLVPTVTASTDPGLPAVAATSASTFVFAAPENLGASIISGQQVGCWTVKTLGDDRFGAVVAHGGLFVSGGTPLIYDGQRLVESGFYSYPEFTAPTSSGGGANWAIGTFSFTWVYEWTDSAGNRHQSAPAPVQSVTLAGTCTSITMSVSTIHATRKQVIPNRTAGTTEDIAAPIRIVCYRTLVNGTTLYRVADADTIVNELAPAGSGVVTSAVAVTNANGSAASVASNEIIYSGSMGLGKLASFAPPPASSLAVHNGRIWGNDPENPERVWCTKTFEVGESPGYSPALQVLIAGCGKVNGIAGQDDKLYGLASGGTYIASYGPGPDNTGGGGGFPDPVLITTAALCDNPKSVISSESGIYFGGPDKWGSGIYHLRRGEGSPVGIGVRVRTELNGSGGYPTIYGVVERNDKGRVEFLVGDGTDHSRSEILYYDFSLPDDGGVGQWTVARPNGGAGLYAIGLWDGVTVISAVDQTYPVQLQTDSYRVGGANIPGTDNGSSFAFTVTTGDVRPFGIAGYGDIHSLTLVGTGRTRAGFLTIGASYNSGVSYPDTIGTNTTEINAPLHRRWEMATKKLPLSSARYRFAEDLVSESGHIYTDGPILHGFVLEAIPLGGNSRLATANRNTQSPNIIPIGSSAVVQVGTGLTLSLLGVPSSFGTGVARILGPTAGVGGGVISWSYGSGSGTGLYATGFTFGDSGFVGTFSGTSGLFATGTTYSWYGV